MQPNFLYHHHYTIRPTFVRLQCPLQLAGVQTGTLIQIWDGVRVKQMETSHQHPKSPLLEPTVPLAAGEG